MNAPTLALTLAARARETPEAPALVVGSESAADETLSYRQLAAATARHAAGLKECALPAEAIVALDGSAATLLQAALACNWAGLAFMPLSANIPDSRWQALLAQAPSRLHRFAGLPPGSTPLDEPAAVSASAPALVISTSGSEGEAKAVLLAHSALAAAATNSRALIPLAAGDVWLACLPLKHVGGLSILWRCLAAGATIRLHEGFDAGAVWHAIRSGQTSHVSLVPAMLGRLLAVADGPPPPSLRCVLIGGAALSRPLWQQARAAGWPLFISYGMSETAAQIATLPPTDQWHEGLVGRPLPTMEIAVGDDGRLRIRGPQLMLGYLGTTDNTPSPLHDGWLQTNDLGTLDDEGRLTILGRADDVLVSAGVNIHPQEVEAQLTLCPGVCDVAVTATHDPIWGDVLTALLVGSAAPEAVREWSRRHLPSALRPRHFQRVAALPRNLMGKLERHRLPALLEEAGR